MALLDLPTRQDYDALQAKLDAVLAFLQAQRPPAADELVSVERVAAYTHFDRRTVEQWVEQGRFDGRGKKVYLPAYQFSGRLRFKLAEVEAFGLGIGVLKPSLQPGGRPEPVKAAPKKSAKSAAVASEQALRVA
ncbi:helix-turn-helix domain-containing protein [Hymenobacter convexus]|uniref:helix-turn-helix domain-containing protein n=1 Tax=Hymenobacter sp. CA1UV-4 TaxID=3063782 RepID=UPI002714161E|nr:helix-turn-helix domain-containing protein [Hymenobacter sp. CA1UV-4]MDO7851589.1 helix-turn-helix domain-containing protein [Hymenobacter sp. CA1UV-4]